MTQQLILIPTSFELQFAQQFAARQRSSAVVELCGLGVVAAAVSSANLLHRLKPQAVLLLGIAGALDAQLPVGAAYQFTEVACYGIGAGSGSSFQTSGELGWPHWPVEPYIGDCLELNTSLAVGSLAGQLLTVCAAASSQADLALRKEKFPAAVAEEMEGFAVAVACRMANVPLQIIRGISNLAGDRDRNNWRVGEAMQAAVQLALQVLEQQ